MVERWHPKQELESLGASTPKPPKRANRVADVIRNELSMLLLSRVRDPHLQNVVISRVELSDDLRHAKIYYKTILGGGTSAAIRNALAKAAGFMRSHLAKALNMRFTPELKFWYDDKADAVENVERLLADIARERDERHKDTEDPE